MGTTEEQGLGYPAAAIARWAAQAEAWATGKGTDGMDPLAKPAKAVKRDVFLYVISGFKAAEPRRPPWPFLTGLGNQRRACGRSVMVPANTSAASPTVSESVGCGWMGQANIGVVGAQSRSPAPPRRSDRRRRGRRCPAPSRRRVSFSNNSLVKPIVPAQRQGAAGGGPREHRLVERHAGLLRLGLGQPDPGDLRVGVGDGGDDTRIKSGVVAASGLPPPPWPHASPCAPASAGQRHRRSRRYARCWSASAGPPG